MRGTGSADRGRVVRRHGVKIRITSSSGRCLDVAANASALGDGVAGGGIKRAAHGDGEREYEYFCAWALFKSKDGKPDSLGAQIKFVVKRSTIENFKEVDGDWRSGGFEGAQKGVESVTALTITNAEIDAAIKRDAKYLK
mgnify:CR=1 FL=1